MVAPVHYQASLREQPYDADPDTKNPAVTGAWTGMSISGEVTAPVVYAHSGNPEDYSLLRAHGISVKGKIVLVRYSNPYSYRGFKALTAEREGAAAMLVYSDPAEDGYKRGEVFPRGPWGPESHIQRGAITYDFMVPGDPLTPGLQQEATFTLLTSNPGGLDASNPVTVVDTLPTGVTFADVLSLGWTCGPAVRTRWPSRRIIVAVSRSTARVVAISVR